MYFEVFAFPEANVTWNRLDNMNMSERFRQEAGNLVIERVQYKDGGFYQATARNILGEVRVTTFLVVKDPGKEDIVVYCDFFFSFILFHSFLFLLFLHFIPLLSPLFLSLSNFAFAFFGLALLFCPILGSLGIKFCRSWSSPQVRFFV